MIRVVVADDQALVRQGIIGLLHVAGIDVVAEADDGMSAVEMIERTGPDVVLLDMRMPRFDGVWTLRQLQERGIDVPVLVLTTFDDDDLVLDAVRAGARGYLLKDVTLDQLTNAVHVLAHGGTLIAPTVTDRLLRAIRTSPHPTTGDALVTQRLTERETEVLRLVASGYSNRQIADALYLAEGTVKNHLSAVLAKLGARDRTNAVLRALRDGHLE
ncbi:response regulator transcription factor [Microbacterium sp. CIAB417]|uniref:response regulator n=1 Tax=Microbacterium sp. CIAB417 TaxID=2860287 RepID=UPI001FAC7EA1|nr:response regulator transcription factor [Microbacterium sp. CIAB417]